MRLILATAAASSLALVAVSGLAGPSGPDFNRDVRPILANHCFKCHGPDDKQRQAGLRLDERDSAVGKLPSGRRAIVAGKPDASELVRRIFATGGAMMPPVAANKPLTDADKRALKQWVAAGAAYEPHWAFVAPVRPSPPSPLSQEQKRGSNVSSRTTSSPFPVLGGRGRGLGAWPRNPIDTFVLAKMTKAGLHPSPEADRYTLCRRLYLDLIGLPPTPEQADAFVKDRRPDAYERLVDSLLASPHYGERWARRWLDLARYADTNGFEKDRPRSVWPYRDWVINALNADMPFDQFTIEQIAGDMLPNATQSQRIATGFHRMTMLNEEGGIDPQEYRFYSTIDRLNTTGTTWLGLTVGCAQCHSHKFDPISQREYYSMLAFLNNAEEPDLSVVTPELAARRKQIEAEAAAREAKLAETFPPAGEYVWETPKPLTVKAASAATAELLPDHSIRIAGANPEADTYTINLAAGGQDYDSLRLEALTDPSLGRGGPGRTPHGNFVVTHVEVKHWSQGAGPIPVGLASAEADFAQNGFPAMNAIDGKSTTGWAIDGPEPWNVNRTLTIHFAQPVKEPAGAAWSIVIYQSYGGHHTLGRFRISLGHRAADARPIEERRKENLQRRYAEWLKAQEAKAVRWTVLRPAKAVSNLPRLTTQPDGSIFVDGDESKRDVYDLDFPAPTPDPSPKNRGGETGITALRLEVLPDERLPNGGPGRVFYEGGHGDFFLSEVNISSGGAAAKIARATASFGGGIEQTIDGDPQTGWSIGGGQGKAHTAVFSLEKPLAGDFAMRMIFERYYAADLGRFRISVTSDPRMVSAGQSAEAEDILATPAAQRTTAQNDRLMREFLATAPELAGERAAIQALRNSEPAYPTTLVFRERDPANPRATQVHHRGEYLQPAETVHPAVLSVLNPLPSGAPLNRLAFARWLVDRRNPLTARVTVNRQWQAFFGRGIVPTLQDFGYQGDPPTNQPLLDWLAVEFMDQCHWSLKKLHRLIVTSATYRQSAVVTPELRMKDPQNLLLARAPRVRLEAELVRDTVLTISAQLSEKICGPSVFPPQPEGVTTQGVYGPLEWRVSAGEDRFRRGLYTFAKRTAPYAMFGTFDAPSGEACTARREVSNTPLQALAMLNDQVLVEAAQALGKMMAVRPGTIEERAAYLFRRCVTRPPAAAELMRIAAFFGEQRKRFESGELKPAALCGPNATAEQAAWTTLARTLLNLDEVVTKG